MLARLSYLTERVLPGQRGRALSMLGGVHRVGVFIRPVLGGLSIKYLGFENTLLIATTMAVLVFGLILIGLPDTGKRLASSHSQNILKQVPGIFIEHKNTFLTAGVATIALVLIRAGRQLLLPLWGEHIGLDAAEIGFIYGVSSAVDMSLFVVAGMIMDHFGRKWTAFPAIHFIRKTVRDLTVGFHVSKVIIRRVSFLFFFNSSRPTTFILVPSSGIAVILCL